MVLMHFVYDMYIYIYGGFLKWWYPQIINFNRVFPYKPSILGYLYLWKHPHICSIYRYFSSSNFISRWGGDAFQRLAIGRWAGLQRDAGPNRWSYVVTNSDNTWNSNKQPTCNYKASSSIFSIKHQIIQHSSSLYLSNFFKNCMLPRFPPLTRPRRHVKGAGVIGTSPLIQVPPRVGMINRWSLQDLEIQTPDLFSPDAMAWPLIPPVGDLHPGVWGGGYGGDLVCVWVDKIQPG